MEYICIYGFIASSGKSYKRNDIISSREYEKLKSPFFLGLFGDDEKQHFKEYCPVTETYKSRHYKVNHTNNESSPSFYHRDDYSTSQSSYSDNSSPPPDNSYSSDSGSSGSDFGGGGGGGDF